MRFKAYHFSAMALVLTFATPAAAFDCAKATTATEKAICANPQALAADTAMAKTYFSLRKKLDAKGRAALLKDQKSWLARRKNTCGEDADCLTRENTKRRETLANTPAGMIPFSAVQPHDEKRHLVEASIYGYRFASPASRGEKAFNRAMDKLIAETPIGKTYNPDDYPAGGYETFEANISIERADKHILSAVVSIYTFSGGAHPNSHSDAVNLFRRSGKAIDPKQIFSRKARHRLADLCARQIVENTNRDISPARALHYLNQEYPGEVAKHIATPSRWHFGKKGAVVRFDSYAIGPYAQGPSQCEFSYKLLRKLGSAKTHTF